MADDLKKRLMGAIGEALTRRFMGGKKFDLCHLPDVTLDALATTLPEFLGISEEHREWLEGALQGLVDQVTADPSLAGDKKGLMGLINEHLRGPGGDKGSGTPQLVDGLTAIAGMSKEAKAAYTAMMALPGAEALIDRLMAVKTTSKTLEAAFLMPTPELQKTTLEKILGRIEADAAKAKAPKPAGKDPLTALVDRVGKAVDLKGMNARLKQKRLDGERAALLKKHPTALSTAKLDDLIAYADSKRPLRVTLLQAFETLHP